MVEDGDLGTAGLFERVRQNSQSSRAQRPGGGASVFVGRCRELAHSLTAPVRVEDDGAEGVAKKLTQQEAQLRPRSVMSLPLSFRRGARHPISSVVQPGR